MVDRIAPMDRALRAAARGGPLTTGELSTLAGVSPRQLRHWVERGFVPAGSPGQGFDWTWPLEAVPFFRAVRRRIELGMAVGPLLFERDPQPVLFLPCDVGKVAPGWGQSIRNDPARVGA